MIERLSDINLILILTFVVLLSSLYKYNNFTFFYIVVASISLYIYDYKYKKNSYTKFISPYSIHNDDPNNIVKIKELTDKFINKFGGLPANYNNVDLKKLPKKFKYLFNNKIIIINLLNLRFVAKLHEIGYVHIFAILERFYMIYFKIVIKLKDTNNIDNLKQLHLLFHHLHDEILLNVPVSNVRYNLTTHDIINTNMKAISIVMIHKIRIIKALIDDKIK